MNLSITTLLIAVLALTTACSVLPPPAATMDPTRYTLELTVTATDTQARARSDKTLLLPLPRIRGELASTRMAYQRESLQLNYFAQSRWADEPNKMLHALLVEMLTGSGPYAHLALAGAPVAVHHRLDIEILDFHQDFSVSPSRFVVKLRVQLVDLQSRRILLERLIEAREPAPSESPQGGAAAANAAVNSLLQRIRVLLADADA